MFQFNQSFGGSPEEIFKQMQGMSQQQSKEDLGISDEMLDTFIKRCCNERDEMLYSLAQILQYKLEAAPMISVAEVQTYPFVIQRCNFWMQQGLTVLQ